MKYLNFMVCTLVLMIFNACGDSPKSKADKDEGHVPTYKIVEREDISTREEKRLRVRAVLPNHYSEQDVRSIAIDIIKASDQPRSEITMFFYGPNSNPQGLYDVARVIWNQDRIAEFDYKQAVVEQVGGLEDSGKSGLLGVPLPKGVKLIEKKQADPSRGADPRERYEIDAQAADILIFFEYKMNTAGWTKDGPTIGTTMFFIKNNSMIGIIVNKNGGTFTLMGS